MVTTAITSAIGISIATISSFFLAKYGRFLVNKSEAEIIDFALKKYLKSKSVELELGQDFKTLVFNIFWENQYNNRQLLSWGIRKLRDKFFKNKDFPGKQEAEKWLKEFNEEMTLKQSVDNPLYYLLNMLQGGQGSEIFEVIIKLMKIISGKNNLKTDVISKLGLNDSSNISDLFKTSENKNTITSSIASLFLGLWPFKNGIQWLIEKSKKAIKDETSRSYLSAWLEFAKVIKKIINKDGFIQKHTEQLKVLYDFQANLINKLIGETKIIEPSKWSSSGIFSWLAPAVEFKVSDIITPTLLKSWFEDSSGVNIKKAA